MKFSNPNVKNRLRGMNVLMNMLWNGFTLLEKLLRGKKISVSIEFECLLCLRVNFFSQFTFFWFEE